MTLKAYASIKIPFHDVDIMEIAWHGHYLKYFEIARTALMQKLQLDWPVLKENGIAMPVVDVEVKYRKPVQYDQEIWVEAAIEEYSFPELVINYTIFAAKHSPEVLSLGRTRQVYVNSHEHNTFFFVPELITRRLEDAMAAFSAVEVHS